MDVLWRFRELFDGYHHTYIKWNSEIWILNFWIFKNISRVLYWLRLHCLGGDVEAVCSSKSSPAPSTTGHCTNTHQQRRTTTTTAHTPPRTIAISKQQQAAKQRWARHHQQTTSKSRRDLSDQGDKAADSMPGLLNAVHYVEMSYELYYVAFA